MNSLLQEETYTHVDTFLAKDKIISMVADCKVPIVIKKKKEIFKEMAAKRPTVASKFNLQ